MLPRPRLAAAAAKHTWLIVPVYLVGQYPSAIPRATLLSEHNKPAAEVDECHVTMLLIDTSRKRIERFDPYAHVAETDPLLQPVTRTSISGGDWAALRR